MAQRRSGRRWSRVLLFVFALAIINVPYGLHVYDQHRAATTGTLVSATVVGVDQGSGDTNVAFRLPKDVDADQKVRTVRVAADVAADAARTHTLPVRVLDGHPSAFHVDGQVRSLGGLYLTVGADLLIALMLLLSWRFGGRIRRPGLVGIAVEDVRPGGEDSLLDQQDDGTYVVNGEVASTGPSTVVLTLRDRDIEVHLRDHENQVGVGDRASVRVQLVG